ncbi:LmeA family phospholipid-binding protein [Arthrobacter sp. ZGTC412]|uniref:LmeA family phospholipid-binding protein n=1 Tax=Arthrobacter sp. ZGTC412 TaxID=2058900 RepID=UPI00215740DC|nr:LmeA family phospholipid-binding protein [Arthrobacter sp. ZGTC412]
MARRPRAGRWDSCGCGLDAPGRPGRRAGRGHETGRADRRTAHRGRDRAVRGYRRRAWWRDRIRAADGGQAMVVRTVEALGRELRVIATGTVEVEAGRLVVEPRSIDFGGPDFLSDATAAVVRRLVAIEHDIEGLPEGLVLQDVAVQGDGFRARLLGEDVQLVP